MYKRQLLAQLEPRFPGEEFVMFLTEPHPVDIEARKKVCLDIVAKYGQGYRCLLYTSRCV